MDRDNVWEKIKKNFKEGAALSIEKIEEYSKIGKLKIEEFRGQEKGRAQLCGYRRKGLRPC